MDRLIINNAPGSRRVRLNREELLAGKCFPNEERNEPDPRIKSPDLVLERLGAEKPSPLDLNHAALNNSTKMAEELERYKTEIEQWKEYKERVNEWKEQVLEIVRQLKEQAHGKLELAAQLKNYKALLRIRDEQLNRLKEAYIKDRRIEQ